MDLNSSSDVQYDSNKKAQADSE